MLLSSMLTKHYGKSFYLYFNNLYDIYYNLMCQLEITIVNNYYYLNNNYYYYLKNIYRYIIFFVLYIRADYIIFFHIFFSLVFFYFC